MLDPEKEIHIVPELPAWCAKIVAMLGAGRTLKPRYISGMKARYGVSDEDIADFIEKYMGALEAAKEAMYIHMAVVNPNEPEVTVVEE